MHTTTTTTPSSSSSSASPSSSSLAYESDEEFAQLLASYDIVKAGEALRQYVAMELSLLTSGSTKQQSAIMKGKFYERFHQILDRVFGNDQVSKLKFGGWLDYAIGVPMATSLSPITSILQLKKKSSSSSSETTEAQQLEHQLMASLTSNGQALVRLLHIDTASIDGVNSIIECLFRMRHPVEFKLELDLLPEQSKLSIMTRSPSTSVLFTQLLQKPVMKQYLDPRHPVLLVTITELYLFYFVRHPSASHQGGETPGSTSTSTSTKRRNDYSWRQFVQDGVLSLTRGNPYNVLLLQYLGLFLPDSVAPVESRLHAKILQHSSVFLHLLIECWLRQNLIQFANDQTQGYGRPSMPQLHHPLATVYTSTTYMPPTDDLLCALLTTIIHLLSDSFYPVSSVAHKSRSSSSNMMMPLHAPVYLTPSVTVLRRPLFEFVRLVFSRAPIGLSCTSFLAISDVWLAYLQPWCCRQWIHGKSTEAEVYTPAYASFVLANYHFYTTLLGGFMERAKELECTDDRILILLERVVHVFTDDLLRLLRHAADALDHPPPASTGHRVRTKSMDKHDGPINQEQTQALVWYTKALGVECVAVRLHDSFHRDAERVYDKLLDASATDQKDKQHERLQRLSQQIVRIFEISEAYVTSSMHTSRSMPSTCVEPGTQSLEPSREKHLLTIDGVLQLLRGQRLCAPESAVYVGDPMRRPIASYEIDWLVRLLYQLSKWLNRQCGLQNPYDDQDFDTNAHVDPTSAIVIFRFNLRFLASKPNLMAFALFGLVVYLVYFI